MRLSFVVEEEQIGLKDYLVNHYSFSFFGYLRQAKAIIKKEDNILDFNDTLYKGDSIIIDFTPKKSYGIKNNKTLDVVYEDEYCIVSDKPFGLPTIPLKRYPDDSVFNRLLYRFEGSENTIHCITRLDMETGGLLLVAKSQLAALMFSREDFIYDKYYLAELSSLLPEENGLIDLPIKRGDKGMKRYVLDDGDPSQTEYRHIKDNLYELHLLTGRTHQIRVHCSYYGCPLVNDPLYGTRVDEGPMHLIAYRIVFVHPFTKEKIELKSRLNF